MAFYRDVLQLPIVHEEEQLVGFETGAFRLYVERGAAHGALFEFLVPDVEGAKARLMDHGCVLVEENSRIPRCYIRDPYGITFNIRAEDQGI